MELRRRGHGAGSGDDVMNGGTLVGLTLSPMPLGPCVPARVFRMEVVGDPARVMPVHERMQAVVARVEGRSVSPATRPRDAPVP